MSQGFPINRANKNYEVSSSAENTTTINLSTNLGDIHIMPIDGHQIVARLESNAGEKLSKGYRLTLKDKNNVVTIKAKKKSKLGTSNKLPVGFKLVVELPTKQYDRLQVHANVSTIHLNSVQANELQLKTNVGNIYINEAVGVISAETNVGDVHLQLLTVVNDIIAKTQVGNISLKLAEEPIALQTNFENSIGNTTISLPSMQNGSIGVSGPLVELTAEVGTIELLLIDH